jgi:hypothetical protein
MTSITLHEGDNRATLRRLIDQGVRVHSICTDPPYGLTSVVKRFGAEKAAPAKFGTDGAFSRASGGFMGQKWDASGIERDPEFWRLIWEILLPGGYVVAFSSPRTGHWQAVAMETAGFIMHPFLGWVYGQGFPKASNAQRAVDVECCALPGRHYERTLPADAREGDHICPESEEGRQFEGFAYGTQSLKPALEPIYVGQKPFTERNGALNILEHGTGAVNIDGCRVPSPGETITNHARGADSAISKGIYGDSSEQETHQKSGQALGRHPANLLHDASSDVVAMFPEAPGQIAPSSSSETRKNQHCYGEMRRGGNVMLPRDGEASANRRYTDKGATNFAALPGAQRPAERSAARFFNAFPFTEADYDELTAQGFIVDLDTNVIHYCPKASKADRAGSKHPTVKPIALKEWLVRLVTPPGGIVLDPFAGSGTTGQAARNQGFDCILMEAQPAYVTDIRRRFGLSDPANDDLDALIGGAPLPDPLMELIG